MALEPIDYVARAINGKSHYPPIRLRKRSGPLGTFDTASASFVGFLSGACGIRPSDRLLDVGCGCGSLALQLLGYFQDGGGYTGVDVDAGAIDWARRSLTRRDPRLRFELADVRNDQYNPDGRESATAFSFPFTGRSVDLIIAKSVFTHMRPHDVRNYLREFARLLAPGGHAVMTFFLLTTEREELVRRGASPRFEHGSGVWRYDDVEVPERAIAYQEQFLLDALRDAGLQLARPILYAHQDVAIATPALTDDAGALQAGGLRYRRR
jgi:SAM-dependent methyltransferase